MYKTKFLISILIFFLSAKFFEVILGALRIGSNLDTPFTMHRAESFLKEGSYTDGQQDEYFAYGPTFGLTTHIFNVLARNSTWGNLGYDPASYQTAHLVVALFSLITVVVVFFTTYAIIKNIPFSLLASLILLSFPFWVGHSFHNIKDIPVAAGLTAFSSGIILYVEYRTKNIKKIKSLGIYLLLFFGIFYSVGSRPFLFLYIFFLLMITLVFLRIKKIPMKNLIFTFTVSLLLTSIFLPHFYNDPLGALRETFLTSSRFPWSGTNLTNGLLLSPRADLQYFSTWFLAQSPLVLIFLTIFATVVAIYNLKKILFKENANRQFFYFVLICQTLGIIVIALAIQTTIYHSLRHFLFIFPSLSILIALLLFEISKPKTNKVIFNSFIFLILILVIPSFESHRLFPYNSLYYNSFVSISSEIPIDWETEAWALSEREAIQYTPKAGNLIVWDPAWEANPFDSERGLNLTESPEMAAGDYWTRSYLVSFAGVDSRERALKSRAVMESLRTTCTLEHVVSRQLRNQVIPMTYISRCQNSGNYQDGLASIAWNSLSEVDENNQKFSWLTSDGDIIRISTLRHFESAGYLNFVLTPNPCDSQGSIKLIVDGKPVSTYAVPVKDSSTNVRIPLTLVPFKSNMVQLKTTNNESCLVGTDLRNFSAKISKISWEE